ncbi:MAG: FAD-dependent oxidoreductase [Pseudomonadales bacterium]|nr:FAD-dependent oxidoreductase [Pseudomonadales bacterium]
MQRFEEPSRSLPVRAECDVLVVGGGPAGIAAAIAAARNGADTLLIERYGSLGGLATGGLIILLLTMDDGTGKPVIAGLCQEMIDALDARGSIVYPTASEWGSQDPALVQHYARWGLIWGRNPTVVRYSVAYDPEEFRFVANELLLSSGAHVLFHTWGARAIMEGDRIQAVAIESKSGREVILPRIIIDASGDGDLFASAGVPFDLEKVHPWLWFRMAGVDTEAAFDSEQPRFFKTPPGKGRILAPWGSAGRIDRQISAVDIDDLTYAEIECRRMVMEEVSRLKRETPGFDDAFLTDIATQLGITESRRMKGARQLTRDEANIENNAVVARTGNWTKAGMLYNIPYGSLYPAEVSNLLVAGRCISVDHRVHHATKEIPACFATGEAAGTAAAMAVASGVKPGDLEVRSLQDRLINQGASLGI